MSNLGNREIFSKNLRFYTEKSGKTQKELSEIVGVATSTFNDWINAKKYPRMNMVEKLANYFGILKSDLIEAKTAEHRDLQKKNDNLTDIVLRLRKDEDFAELVNLLIKLNQVQLTSIKQIIAAFLEKSWYFSGEVGKWNQEVPHQQKAVILRFFQYNPFASQPLPFLFRQRRKLSIALVGANYMIKKFLKQYPNLIFEESNFYKKTSNKK